MLLFLRNWYRIRVWQGISRLPLFACTSYTPPHSPLLVVQFEMRPPTQDRRCCRGRWSGTGKYMIFDLWSSDFDLYEWAKWTNCKSKIALPYPHLPAFLASSPALAASLWGFRHRLRSKNIYLYWNSYSQKHSKTVTIGKTHYCFPVIMFSIS